MEIRTIWKVCPKLQINSKAKPQWKISPGPGRRTKMILEAILAGNQPLAAEKLARILNSRKRPQE
jgi:hypothetical protein